jgi:hypothetical protein
VFKQERFEEMFKEQVENLKKGGGMVANGN